MANNAGMHASSCQRTRNECLKILMLLNVHKPAPAPAPVPDPLCAANTFMPKIEQPIEMVEPKRWDERENERKRVKFITILVCMCTCCCYCCWWQWSCCRWGTWISRNFNSGTPRTIKFIHGCTMFSMQTWKYAWVCMYTLNEVTKFIVWKVIFKQGTRRYTEDCTHTTGVLIVFKSVCHVNFCFLDLPTRKFVIEIYRI